MLGTVAFAPYVARVAARLGDPYSMAVHDALAFAVLLDELLRKQEERPGRYLTVRCVSVLDPCQTVWTSPRTTTKSRR